MTAKDALDVLEVRVKSPHHIRVLDTQKSRGDAEAIVKMAVMRRGVDEYFYIAVPAGVYRDGDTLNQSPIGERF